MNSTLSQAVMTLDSDLTSLEMNVSALDDHVETELTVLDDRVEQLELTGTSNVLSKEGNKLIYQQEKLFS